MDISIKDFPRQSQVKTLQLQSFHHLLQAFVQQFLRNILDLTSTRNVNEVRELAQILYPKYREPVDRGDLNPENAASLYQRLLPLIKKNILGRISLKEVSAKE